MNVQYICCTVWPGECFAFRSGCLVRVAFRSQDHRSSTDTVFLLARLFNQVRPSVSQCQRTAESTATSTLADYVSYKFMSIYCTCTVRIVQTTVNAQCSGSSARVSTKTRLERADSAIAHSHSLVYSNSIFALSHY